MSESLDPGGDDILIRPISDCDRDTVQAALVEAWSGPVAVVHDEQINMLELPALVAVAGSGELLGVVTFRDDECGYEVISLNALVRASGIGTRLLSAVFELARTEGRTRVWLITTNDNLDAIRFYQRRGMRLVGVDCGAVDRARARKPAIPLIGEHGIELHDELAFEIRF